MPVSARISPILSAGEVRSFNPQPEPPRQAHGLSIDPGSVVGFNPQPEPPRDVPGGSQNHADTMSEATQVTFDWSL